MGQPFWPLKDAKTLQESAHSREKAGKVQGGIRFSYKNRIVGASRDRGIARSSACYPGLGRHDQLPVLQGYKAYFEPASILLKTRAGIEPARVGL